MVSKRRVNAEHGASSDHSGWLLLLILLARPTAGQAAPPREPNLVAAVQTVMKAMVAATQANQKLPPDREGERGPAPFVGTARRGLRTDGAGPLSPGIPQGHLASGQVRRDKDELTELLFRRGAAAAQELPVEVGAKAYLLALGLTVDDSTVLRVLPGFSSFCSEVEPEEQRRARLAVLGAPTMRGRRDSAQHFVVSAALTAWIGVTAAETAGMAKEVKDAVNGTGFSFVDLSSDLSGTTFAVAVQENRLSLARLAESFVVTDFLPDPAGLREGHSWAEFTRLYGSVNDDRFGRQVDAIRERIRMLPGHCRPK